MYHVTRRKPGKEPKNYVDQNIYSIHWDFTISKLCFLLRQDFTSETNVIELFLTFTAFCFKDKIVLHTFKIIKWIKYWSWKKEKKNNLDIFIKQYLLYCTTLQEWIVPLHFNKQNGKRDYNFRIQYKHGFMHMIAG